MPSAWRRLGTGTLIKYLLLSEGAAEAIRPGQTEGDRHLADSPPPTPLPWEEFPWRAKMCLSLPACQEL